MVGDFLDHLAVERGVAANTLAAYGRDLRRYVAHLAALGVPALGAVSEPVVAGFLAALREGDDEHPPLSASSAARALVAVRGLHRFAVRDGIVAADVARAVRPPAPPRRLPKAISVDDVERLLEAAGFDGTPLALAGPGAARGALRDRRADLRGGRAGRRRPRPGRRSAVVLRGKGGKERVVPVGSYALRAVDDYLVRSRPVLAAAGRGDAAAVPQRARRPAVPAERVDDPAGRRPSGPGWRRRCPRTRCATRTRPTCSTGEPTSGWSRSCSATRR